MHQERVRHAREPGDRREVAREVEGEPLVERGVDGVGRGADQDGVAVRRRVDDAFGRDIAAGARLVLDHELLAEPLGETLADEARQHIGRPARRKSDHQPHRPGRIVEGAGIMRAGERKTRQAEGNEMRPHDLLRCNSRLRSSYINAVWGAQSMRRQGVLVESVS